MQHEHSQLWSFLEQCERARTVDEIGDAFMGEMGRLGFANGCLSSAGDPLRPGAQGFVVRRAPAAWVERYSAQGYYLLDPIRLAGRASVTPFRWENAAFREGLAPVQIRMLDELLEVGLRGGFAIPLRGADGTPAMTTVFSGDNEVDPQAYFLAHAMAVFTHDCVRRVMGAPSQGDCGLLSTRERDCLALVARGKSDWTIGELLGVSESAAHKTIERAKRKLDVATRMQAVVRAIHLGEIRGDETME